MEVKLRVHNQSIIVGKTIGQVEKVFDVKVKQVNNTSDRAFMFSWEIPPKTTTIKSDDEVVAVGEPRQVQEFSELVASLN